MSHFLSFAFRPMFLLAIGYGILAVPYWALAWAGLLPLPTLGTHALQWHAHEMVFGFAGAAIAGFSLTAVANWTGRRPIQGAWLGLLCTLWLAARLSATANGPNALLVTALSDIGFDLALCLLFAREVFAANNQRNYKLVGLLLIYTLANAAFYLGSLNQAPWVPTATWAGLFTIALLVNLIGGRIIPAFTGNWLTQRARQQQNPAPKRPPAFAQVDQLATLATVIFFVAWLLDRNNPVTALSGLVAAIIQGIRWIRWQGYRTWSSPIVWALHLAFLWLILGLALLAGSCLNLLPASAGLHALSSGAFTTMILAVASRAAMGHTGRPLEDHWLVTWSYISITAATVLRITATIPGTPGWLMPLAALCWFLAFLMFGARHLPILLGAPQDNN